MCASIEYRFDIVPGQRYFTCQRMHATISTTSCGDRFRRAGTSDDWREGRYACCARCHIGQYHAEEMMGKASGQPPVPAPLPDLGATYCVRCGRSGLRIIASTSLCISCHNREGEVKRGYNARGNVPVEYVQARPRLVGVIDKDGRPAWQTFDGRTFSESLARAVRARHQIHDNRPGRTRWNEEARHFEYMDEQGHLLLQLEVDGIVEFVAVPSLHPGEQPAPVVWPGFEMSPAEVKDWLDLSCEADGLESDWRFTEFSCGTCHHGQIQARRRGGETQVRCTRCQE